MKQFRMDEKQEWVQAMQLFNSANTPADGKIKRHSAKNPTSYPVAGREAEALYAHSYLRSEGAIYRLPPKNCDFLGKGAFGKVKITIRQAADGTQEMFAIKIIKIKSSVQLFEKEILEKLGLLKGFIERKSSGKIYLVMPYYSSGDLFLYLHNHRLNLTEQFNMGIQVALQVHALHEQGIAHLDLKPENIMQDEKGLQIIDYGHSRLIADLNKHSWRKLGTAYYHDNLTTPLQPEEKHYKDSFALLRILHVASKYYKYKADGGETVDRSYEDAWILSDSTLNDHPSLGKFIDTADGTLRKISAIQIAAVLLLFKNNPIEAEERLKEPFSEEDCREIVDRLHYRDEVTKENLANPNCFFPPLLCEDSEEDSAEDNTDIPRFKL